MNRVIAVLLLTLMAAIFQNLAPSISASPAIRNTEHTQAVLSVEESAPGVATLKDDPDDVYWSSLGNGPNDIVYAAIVYSGKLIVGGMFTNPAPFLASWDGSSWASVGAYSGGTVRSMTVYDNKLIIGGSTWIRAWDGTTWTTLASGLDGLTRSLCVYNNKLIAAGLFTSINGVSANRIAAWDGTTWSPLGSGLDNMAYALIAYSGSLIAGGEFHNSGSVPIAHVARWDGLGWSQMSGGSNSPVHSLEVYNGQLVVAGNFMDSATGWWAGYGVSAWSGTDWRLIGDVFYGDVTALTTRDNELIAGTADYSGFVKSWNGISWQLLGSGPNDQVLTLAEYQRKLVVGGRFTQAGGKPIGYVASWSKLSYLCGDANGDRTVNISDAVYLIAYIFSGGPAPSPLLAGDANCSGSINISDAVYLIAYIFSGGPQPCAGCK